MVCSSTLIAMAVIHSAKWWKPRRVKAQAKALSRACQMDQVSLASVMMRLLCRGQLGWGPPGRFRPGDAAFQYGTPAQLLWSFSWKLLNKEPGGRTIWDACAGLVARRLFRLVRPRFGPSLDQDRGRAAWIWPRGRYPRTGVDRTDGDDGPGLGRGRYWSVANSLVGPECASRSGDVGVRGGAGHCVAGGLLAFRDQFCWTSGRPGGTTTIWFHDSCGWYRRLVHIPRPYASHVFRRRERHPDCGRGLARRYGREHAPSSL